MPASIIGELILRPVLELIFHVLGYYLGRVVVFIFTLGRIKCDRLLADTPRRKAKWAGTYHRRAQTIYLTADATAILGFLFIAMLIGVGILVWYLNQK